MRKKLREEMQIEFTIENGQLHIFDGIRVTRRPRAAVTIAVSLAKDKIITKEEALMRVDPRAVGELLHRQIDPNAERNILAKGCLLYTSPSPRDLSTSRMPSSA